MPKPYDEAFKSLADEDPRGLLDLLGILPLQVEAEVEPLERELVGDPMFVDQMYRVRLSDGQEWIAHFESESWYRSDIRERMGWCGVGVAYKMRVPIVSVLLLLAPHGVPAEVAEKGEWDLGDIRIHYRFRVIRLWEVDCREVLDKERKALYPWVVLMRSTEQDRQEALRRIRMMGEPNLAANYAILGGLRYGKDEGWKQFLERTELMIREEILEQSMAVQHWMQKGESKGREQGLEQGLEKGREEGRLEEARRLVRAVWEGRFPGTQAPALDNQHTVELLESLFNRILASTEEASARSLFD